MWNLQSCQNLPAKKTDVKLPDSLAHSIDSLPNIDELPKSESSTEANLDLLKKVETEFIQIESYQPTNFMKSRKPLPLN